MGTGTVQIIQEDINSLSLLSSSFLLSVKLNRKLYS